MAIWYILWPLGIFYGYLVYIFPVLVRFTIINLATLFCNPDYPKESRGRYLLFVYRLNANVSIMVSNPEHRA
jgi:hypothetical protein